ncbi:hypothetical protein ZWY2020_043823 [Hordeum vulgare]|nr:hypothetical protein ZWY2020_043823 [Hordeum vulgare]
MALRAFWLGTDQPRTGLAVLASSAPARLLLHLAVLVSSAASILQCCGSADAQLEVKLSAMPGCDSGLVNSPRRPHPAPSACLAAIERHLSSAPGQPPPRSGSKEGELPAPLRPFLAVAAIDLWSRRAVDKKTLTTGGVFL